MLTLILHLFIGATLSGVAIIAALVMGQTALAPILIAAAVGLIVAFPISHFVAKKLTSL